MTDANTVQANESEPVASTTTEETAKPVEAPAANSPTSAKSASSGWFNKYFWLNDRIEKEKALGFSMGHPGFAEFDLARQARAGITQIGETGENNGAVLLLERIEVLSLLRAHLLKGKLPQTGIACLTEDDWTKLKTLAPFSEVYGELSSAQQTAVVTALGPDAERELVKLDSKGRRQLASALRKLSAAMSAPLEFEANRLGRVLFARWSRIGVAAGLVIGALVACYAVINQATAKPNLALHRQVTTSSQFPGQSTDYSLLVDGDATNLGFHTNAGPGEWCVIDLGGQKSISRVVVTNRADCCQDRAVPLKILISSDGQNYQKVAERRDQFDVWTASGLNTKGRYVKIQHGGANFLHLSEVEVY